MAGKEGRRLMGFEGKAVEAGQQESPSCGRHKPKKNPICLAVDLLMPSFLLLLSNNPQLFILLYLLLFIP